MTRRRRRPTVSLDKATTMQRVIFATTFGAVLLLGFSIWAAWH